MKAIKVALIFGVFLSVFFKCDLYAQCGAGVENIAITNYCNNQYASWTITNPQTGSSYRWNAASSYDVTNPGGTGTDYGYSSTFNSPTRLATPTGTATGQVQYYYVKETSVPSLIPWPGSVASPGGPTSTFAMTFTTTSVVRMNSVAVPIKVYNATNTYKTQIRIQGPSGFNAYSPVLSFLGSSATNIAGSDYLVTVPVALSLTATGTYTMSVIYNPATGTGNNLDGMIWTNGAFAGASGQGINVESGFLNSIYSPNVSSSVIYNWNYTSYCGPNPSGFAFPTTTGCCTPVYNNPTIGAADNIIQTGLDIFTISSVNFAECTGTGCYYQWFKNGVSIAGANGLNKSSLVATTSGVYTSRIVLNSAFINNQSCYSESNWSLDERVLFAALTAPGVSPYCLGSTFYFNSTVTGSNIQWTPASGLSSTTTKSTTYTANTLGNVQITVSADIITGDKILNGDFETGVITPSSSQLTLQGDPGNVDGSYKIANSVPAQDNGSGGNSYWKSCSGSGKFMIANGFPSNANTQVWAQNGISVTPNKTYTLTFDITNISRNACYTCSATAADTDVQLQVFINNVTVGGVITAGANGIISNLCSWKTNTLTWTAGSADVSANIVIRQVNLFSGIGLDFGLDNIRFGGGSTQNKKITIGPITDCSTITAFAGACSGTSATLTASVTGGMVFDHWEKPLGTVVGTNITLSLGSTTGGVYTAFGVLPLQNVLSNGSFEGGNTGFMGGNPNYYSYQSAILSGAGATNGYTITSNTNAGNAPYWLDLTPPVTTSSLMFVSDNKAWNTGGLTGNKIIGWSFTATAGQKFRFSGYAANQHRDVTLPTGSGGVIPANIAITINSATITSLSLPKTNAWNYLTSIWTAPTTGSYVLDVVDLANSSANGNDLVLDEFALQPLFGTFKTATVTGPVCVLSIELQSFEVSKKSNGVQLDWKSFSSKNKNGFYIERSNDGINFTTIGFVDSPSISNNGSEAFSFLDKKPLEGINYYRLKQVDLNGKEDYSEIKSINLQEYVIQVYPNPNNGLFTIYWGVKNTFAKILIYNALGTLVYETESEPYTSSKDISLQNLASGLYSAIISTNGATQTIKLVKE